MGAAGFNTHWQLALRALSNDVFLRALRREATTRTPVWIMRQAGRYLPEYRATRAQAGSFVQLMKNPELACEVTLQPLRRFPLDAAILFSDILTIPDAMGLGLYFEEGEGPRFERCVRTPDDVAALEVPDIKAELGYVFEAVARIREQLGSSLPLIGFSGSPWTLMTYMVEGRSSRDFKHAKAMLYATPEAAQQLLNKLVAAISQYLLAQIDAGADALMLFDSWGGALAANQYLEFSLKPMQRILSAIKAAHPTIPVIVFSKGAHAQLDAMSHSGADALGLDWTISLAQARRICGGRVALQGNVDPTVLLADPAQVRTEVRLALESYGHGHGHIFNLGHGITPDVRPENLATLITSVHELSPEFHRN